MIFGLSMLVVILAVLIFLGAGIRIVRPTERGLIERLGKYHKFAEAGFHWIIPVVDNMIQIDITENMMEIDAQEIITEDNLNAKVDLVVYYKVLEDEGSVRKSVYKVESFEPQITILAQTTARNVIGTMNFKDVNSKRDKLNKDIAAILKKETANWGVEILRVELKEIIPPREVQETMNQVIQAENAKRASVDFATANETKADGEKRAEIKKAEGIKQALILKAEGEAEAIKTIAKAEAEKIKVVNESLRMHFKDNAQIWERLKTTEKSLEKGTKYVMDSKSNLVNVISEQAGIIPIPTIKK